jgi:phosphomannomutase
LVAELLSQSGKTLSSMVCDRINKYPSSGEINRTVVDADLVLTSISEKYASQAIKVEVVDGLSVQFVNWRFNVRKSNTEPLLRLNVESDGDKDLMVQKTNELLNIIDRNGR